MSHLASAIASHVNAGMHLHFASTPSRSNAAVREVARLFRDRSPGFTISSSGFHSYLHLLARLRLGRKYIACFFGDNFPSPRPNSLYQELHEDPASELEIWSLLTYVEALRAGALGLPFAVTNSLRGTDMARDLATSGAYVEQDVDGQRVSLVRALRPDVVFVHALLGDEDGNLVFSQPSSEGFWSTIGAKTGVIATVEKKVSQVDLERFSDAMPVPKHQVLAIAEEPGATHPQPVFAHRRFGIEGHVDDLDHYELWRKLATDDDAFQAFDDLVLQAEDGAKGYEEFRFWADHEENRRSASKQRDTSSQIPHLILAARVIRDAVIAGNYRTIIAGIGQSFFAARLAKLWLDEDRIQIDVIVETGLIDIECGKAGHSFLLSHDTMAQAKRISNAEFALGSLTCGADNRCLGIIGAGQIDLLGRLNSTMMNGKFLVGSGGANDIASSAAEVIVLTRCSSDRMRTSVDYVTSPGHRVQRIVTESGVFSRKEDSSTVPEWRLESLGPASDAASPRDVVDKLRGRIDWPFDVGDQISFAAPVAAQELEALQSVLAQCSAQV